MENNILITLEGLLKTIANEQNIIINLFDEMGNLLITFNLSGYESIEDTLRDDEVISISIKSLNKINIDIDTSLNI